MKTFGSITREGKRWKMKLEAHVAIRARRLFRKLDGQYGTLEMDHNDEVAKDLVWFMERYPLEISEEDMEFLKSEESIYDMRFDQFIGVLSGEYEPREFKMKLPPREYQKIAAELILQQKRILIADDLGIGKSCSAIAALTQADTLPALVVTQTYLPVQWEREIHKFIPDIRTHIINKGKPYDIPAAMRRGGPKFKGGNMELRKDVLPDVLIVNYSKLAGWSDTLAGKVRMVIFDEIQELRRDGTKKYNAATNISHNAMYRVGLSATPVYNRGGEVYNVMEVLSRDALGDWKEFAAEWCGSKHADRAKASVNAPRAFGTYLREQCLMIRRTRAEVGRELPELIKIPHHVDSDAKVIEKVEGDLSELARIMLESTDYHERGRAAGEMDWKLRHATGVAKAPYVAEFVKMLLEAGEPKVLLFGWHRACYDIWMEKLKQYNPVMFTGSESANQKNKARDRFIEDPNCKVLIMSLRSGAGLDGLQYSSCRTVVIGELDWSPKIHDQGIGRVHRDGQKEPTTAFFMVSDEGSDPYVSDVLGLKQAEIEAIRDPSGKTMKELVAGGEEKRLKEIAENILARSPGRR